MRLSKILVLLLLTLHTILAMADVKHYFSTIKNDPVALHQFLKDMPKGGDLHYHLTGGASSEVMLSLAKEHNFCIDTATYSVQPAKSPCSGTSLKNLKKDSALYTNILHAWSFKDFTPRHESGHDHFFEVFFKFAPIASAFPPELLADVMKRAAMQHELYLEIMFLGDHAHSSTFGPLLAQAHSFEEKRKLLLANPQFRDNINLTVKESSLVLKNARQLLGCNSETKIAACDLTIKLQYIILREQPLNNFFAQALNGFISVSQSNDLVGINLVQAEDGPLSLHDYHQQMRILNFLHRAYPKVHISLHAGELSPDQLKENNKNKKALQFHIRDALTLGNAERIGHGSDIQYEQESNNILKRMVKTSTPVEICLTSNHKILNLSNNNHPIRHYLDHQVPIVLSTDDEGILKTTLTNEYVSAVINHGIDYDTLKTINRNALTYSFLPGQSIWKNPAKTELVPECLDMESHSCQKFIELSDKAKLQRKLELQLSAFENRYKDASF